MIEDQGISLSTTRGLVPNVAVYYFDIYDGEYELKEIKSPDNYVLNDDEIEFKVVENDEVYYHNIYSRPRYICGIP